MSSQSLYLADEFQYSHLQNVPPMRYIVHLAQQVMNCSVLCMVAQHQECIALCGQVLLAVEHFLYQVWCILQVLLALGELVYGVDGQDSIAPHIRMPVLQACENGGYQWLKDLLFPYSTQESERDTPYVLVWVLQIVPQVLANQDLQPRGEDMSELSLACK